MQGYPRIVQRQDESLEKNVLRLLILYFEHKWFLVAFKFVNTLQVEVSSKHTKNVFKQEI